MINTAIITDVKYTHHLTGSGHPESPGRITAIINRLKQYGYTMTPPRYATVDEVALCHSREYIDLVRLECLAASDDGSSTLSTGDVQISRASYETALLAAGGVLTGVDAVMTGKAKNAFCAVRPPGHHASYQKGEGFCLFNNIAIGARYAEKTYGIKRVAILDWDVHHGNGTQAIFELDPTVYYLSTHQFPSYPGTGMPDERGVGNIRNFPITYGGNPRQQILSVFSEVLVNDMKEFKPDLVMISAGFDSRIGDPLGFFNLTDEAFQALTRIVMLIADEYAQGRLISVFEGGYNLDGLASATAQHIATLSDNQKPWVSPAKL